jgi:hypothetical protein
MIKTKSLPLNKFVVSSSTPWQSHGVCSHPRFAIHRPTSVQNSNREARARVRRRPRRAGGSRARRPSSSRGRKVRRRRRPRRSAPAASGSAATATSGGSSTSCSASHALEPCPPPPRPSRHCRAPRLPPTPLHRQPLQRTGRGTTTERRGINTIATNSIKNEGKKEGNQLGSNEILKTPNLQIPKSYVRRRRQPVSSWSSCCTATESSATAVGWNLS